MKKTNDPTHIDENILVTQNLKKYFDVTDKWFTKDKQYLKAVDGINLRVKKGETLGIVGESGSGKSTTADLMARLIEPTEGKVFFENTDIGTLSNTELRELRKDIQVIFQDPYSSLNPRMKVRDIISEPLKTHKIVAGDALEKQIYELLDMVGLDKSYVDRYPHEFSGGQRQRIGIARAVALKPKLIICDEPISSLDVSIQSQILNLLVKFQKEFNITYVFIAHGLPAIKHISDQVAVMYLGSIVESASKESIFENPRHPYTEALISAIPSLNPNKRNENNKITLKGDIPSPTNIPNGCRFHTRCPYADQKCREVEPEFRELSPDHFVACHYPRGNFEE